jgi:preprotein translocase subunit YajC
MNRIETIFLFSLFLIVTVLAFYIDRSQIKRHKKIKQDYLKSLRDELSKYDKQ